MGGKYLVWYEETGRRLPSKRLNAGIFGGRRDEWLRFAGPMEAALKDPDLALGENVNVTWFDMAAFNYALLAEFPLSDIVTGYPLHSACKRYEKRRDVYLKHK
mmetsp:Transcript_102290/g.286796  ORF Transcript_102290/g.286796 Transcript_102290/m.286796 type:complete len:103 (+) Transcript_102290:426-734(+)